MIFTDELVGPILLNIVVGLILFFVLLMILFGAILLLKCLWCLFKFAWEEISDD